VLQVFLGLAALLVFVAARLQSLVHLLFVRFGRGELVCCGLGGGGGVGVGVGGGGEEGCALVAGSLAQAAGGGDVAAGRRRTSLLFARSVVAPRTASASFRAVATHPCAPWAPCSCRRAWRRGT
jgi:hypothetical protein